MKKFSKIVLASGIVLGFSVTPELFNATEDRRKSLSNLIIIMMVILRIKVDLY